jgi:hypothetical protein
MRNPAPRIAVLAVLLLAGPIATAQQALLVHYDPAGPQETALGVAPTVNLIGASRLNAVGYENWGNTDVFPVGYISKSDTVDFGRYLEFTVDGGGRTGTLLESITYRALNYLNNVPLKAELRYSGDNYQDYLAQSVQTNGTGTTTLTFDFNDFFLSEPTTFRIYFYDADPAGADDFFDLIGSARGIDNAGLRLNGSLDVPPAPPPAPKGLRLVSPPGSAKPPGL